VATAMKTKEHVRTASALVVRGPVVTGAVSDRRRAWRYVQFCLIWGQSGAKSAGSILRLRRTGDPLA
jgi:hypothetical protein